MRHKHRVRQGIVNYLLETHFFEQLSDIACQIHQVSPQKLPIELPTKQDILENYFFRYLGRKGTKLQKEIFQKLAHNSIFGLGKAP